MLVIDFETRSRCDLKTAGADKYAADPSTEVLCLCWSLGMYTGQFVPKGKTLDELKLREYLKDEDILIAAHNARFDQLIYEYIMVNDHGFPPVARNRWYCTSAQARLNGLPANLDDATRALNTKHQKSFRGAQLIKQLCIPDPETGVFLESPELLKEMVQYCHDDVAATQSLVDSTRNMTAREHVDWLVNERINDRGVLIDHELATMATDYAFSEQKAINGELDVLTNGQVEKYTQTQRIRNWLLHREPSLIKPMTKYVNGEAKMSLDKTIRQQILDGADAGELSIDDKSYDVIAALDDGNKSSVSKYKTMLARAEDDHRVRGSFIYAGAQTVRFSSRGLQLHNMRRDALSAQGAENVKGRMQKMQPMSDVMTTLAKLLRPTLIPAEGKVFVAGDWSSIESRALAYLAEDPKADLKLEAFKRGDDMYLRAAADVGQTGERQLGKVIELSMGYGGGVGAFKAMGRSFGISLPDHVIDQHKNAWRSSNRWAPVFWKNLERKAKSAIRHPNVKMEVSRGISYLFDSDLMGGALLCTLPDGTTLSYPKARVEGGEITAMKAAYGMRQDATEWPRYKLWGGLLAENVTQAFCAALLREALLNVPDVVMHVHDEIISEVPREEALVFAADMQLTMETPPTWAVGLPLEAEPQILTRYGKG